MPYALRLVLSLGFMIPAWAMLATANGRSDWYQMLVGGLIGAMFGFFFAGEPPGWSENPRGGEPMTRDPSTAREWQEAIDAAARLLDNDTARRYGLVNVERCEELIE